MLLLERHCVTVSMRENIGEINPVRWKPPARESMKRDLLQFVLLLINYSETSKWLLMLTDYAPVKEERSRKVFGLRVALPDSSS